MMDYQSAGVNIDLGNEVVERIKLPVKKTFSAQVLTDLGGFAGLYDLKNIIAAYEEPVLVQSIDGLGTKPVIAGMMQRYDTLGYDLLSATANDIIVCGAKPLTLLDYIGTEKIHPEEIVTLIEGLTSACIEQGVSLIGGETAEMPGIYTGQEYDVVGIITGVVEKKSIVNGKSIVPGDRVLGFASSGLHTNGYSLARKLCFTENNYHVSSYVPELGGVLGEILLTPHHNYTRPILTLLQHYPIKGMAHITGGGLLDNIPRILPMSCRVEIDTAAWPMPLIFSWLTQLGQLEFKEAYRTLNMGIGYILVVGSDIVPGIMECVQRECQPFKLYEIGRVVEGLKGVELQ